MSEKAKLGLGCSSGHLNKRYIWKEGGDHSEKKTGSCMIINSLKW